MHSNDVRCRGVQLALDSRSAIAEDWRLDVMAGGRFKLRGLTVGVVAAGALRDVVAPINPASNRPFFTLKFAHVDDLSPGDMLSFSTAALTVARAPSSRPSRRAARGARPRSRSAGSRSRGDAAPDQDAAQ